MAMFMMNVGILALVAAFNSGAVALQRASHVSTAAALADSQMELYRGLTYAQIGLDATALAAVDNTYKCDVAQKPAGASVCPNTVTACALAAGSCADYTVQTKSTSCALNECTPTRTVTAATSPDHYPYRVDSYIRNMTPTSGRQLRQITVVVRDGNLASRVFARQTSTFDPSTSG